MLNREMTAILERAKDAGWVLEPDAKSFFRQAGLPVPRHALAKTFAEAESQARKIGWPVVAKVVSPAVVHKSDVGGVAVGLADARAISEAWTRFSALPGFAGMLIEEMLAPGLECIVGAKNDFQFGPVVLFGMGGVGVEIYQDTAIRMAPFGEKTAHSLIGSLKASRLFDGYRGARPVDRGSLARMLTDFSRLVAALGDGFESIDCNPVRCYPDGCVIADARIILPR